MDWEILFAIHTADEDSYLNYRTPNKELLGFIMIFGITNTIL